MKKKRRLIAVILLIVTVADVLFAISSLQKQPGINEKNIFLSVGNHTGFNVGTDAIYFGTMLPETSAKRFLIITNDVNTSLRIRFSYSGNVTQFVSSVDEIVLNAMSNETVEITASVPPGTKFGDYSGKLAILSEAIR